MEIILIVMLWEISLALSFIFGFYFKNKSKGQIKEKAVTEEEKKHLKRVQKEQENFMTYDGTEQKAINDYA